MIRTSICEHVCACEISLDGCGRTATNSTSTTLPSSHPTRLAAAPLVHNLSSQLSIVTKMGACVTFGCSPPNITSISFDGWPCVGDRPTDPAVSQDCGLARNVSRCLCDITGTKAALRAIAEICAAGNISSTFTRGSNGNKSEVNTSLLRS
jgi:hypothetical protein